MELWIRSQDKMVLTRNVGTRIVLEQEGASIVDETYDYILGMYNTEKRALEVLDEIQSILNTYNRVNGKTGNYEDLDLSIKVNMLNYVYEMPKE